MKKINFKNLKSDSIFDPRKLDKLNDNFNLSNTQENARIIVEGPRSEESRKFELSVEVEDDFVDSTHPLFKEYIKSLRDLVSKTPGWSVTVDGSTIIVQPGPISIKAGWTRYTPAPGTIEERLDRVEKALEGFSENLRYLLKDSADRDRAANPHLYDR